LASSLTQMSGLMITGLSSAMTGMPASDEN
jgi:hypothetical protein